MQLGSWSLNTVRGLHGRRAALALVDQLMVGAGNFLTILMLGRLAGPHELGVFALVMTVYYLLLTVQDSLITVPYTILVVQLKGLRHRQYSGATLCHNLAWSACVAAILAIVALALYVFGDDSNVAIVVAAFALVAPLWLLREFGRRYLFAHLQLSSVMIMTVVASLAQLITLCALAYCNRLSAVTALIAVGIGSGVAGFGWLWLSRNSFAHNRQRWSYFTRKNWVTGRWLLACQATGVITTYTMPWLVWLWLGSTATGLFAACDSMIRFANPIIVSLNNVLTPRIAHGFKEGGKAELNRLVWKATALLILFLSAFCIVLALTGEWFLNRSFGKTYAGFWSTLVVLGINQLVSKCALAPSRALILLDRVNINLLAEGASFVATLLVAPLLIPLYGCLGAALAMLAGSVVESAVTVGYYLAEMSDCKAESFMAMGPAMPSAAPLGGVLE